MKAVEYERMAAIEDRMWWYRNLHHNLLTTIERGLGAPLGEALSGKQVLDAGCGTGGFLARLEAAAPEATLHGVDISDQAVTFTQTRTSGEIRQGSVDDLPYANGQFDLIVSADVLYHGAVNEPAAIASMRRCLAPGGLMIVNLPAYNWLKSYHDEAVGGARRYTRAGTCRLFEDHGLETRAATYWNTVFFPAMVLKRKLFPNNNGDSDVSLMSPILEATFYSLTGLERGLIERGVSLSFGGSVMWAGQSPREPN